MKKNFKYLAQRVTAEPPHTIALNIKPKMGHGGMLYLTEMILR